MVQILGGASQDGPDAVYANEMVSSIGYDVCYHHENPQILSTTILWNWGTDRMDQSVNAKKLSDFTASSNVKVEGKEFNGLGLHGPPENNPFFAKELASPTDRASDPHPKEGNPASGNGYALPEGIVKTLGVSASVPVNRSALVNVVWGSGVVPGAGDALVDNTNNSGETADNGDKAANNNGGNGGDANNGGKTSSGDKVANNSDKVNNGDETDNNGSTTTDEAADIDGKDV